MAKLHTRTVNIFLGSSDIVALITALTAPSLFFDHCLRGCLSSLFLLYYSGLLNGLCHHLLLLKSLPNVVSIQADVAVLAESEQISLRKAAECNRDHSYNHHQIGSVNVNSIEKVILRLFI